jgi:hypothetical protein
VNIKVSVFPVIVCLLKTANFFATPLPLIFSLFYLSNYILILSLPSIFFPMLFLISPTFFFLYPLKANLHRVTLSYRSFPYIFPSTFIACVCLAPIPLPFTLQMFSLLAPSFWKQRFSGPRVPSGMLITLVSVFHFLYLYHFSCHCLLFCHEDGGSKFFWRISISLPKYMVSHPRRP